MLIKRNVKHKMNARLKFTLITKIHLIMVKFTGKFNFIKLHVTCLRSYNNSFSNLKSYPILMNLLTLIN